MSEELTDVKKLCKCSNFEMLDNKTKKHVLENQYKKQKFWREYSVSGADYEPIYDTGKPRDDTDPTSVLNETNTKKRGGK